MGYFLILLVLIVVIPIWILISMEFAAIAEAKGYADRKYFWYTLLFGIIGMLMIAALPDRGNNSNHN